MNPFGQLIAHDFYKIKPCVSDAHVLPTPVSESEIQMVASTVSDHWILLSKILGIEEEFSKLSVSGDGGSEVSGDGGSEERVTALLVFWQEHRKEVATSEELQTALKTLATITSSGWFQISIVLLVWLNPFIHYS